MKISARKIDQAYDNWFEAVSGGRPTSAGTLFNTFWRYLEGCQQIPIKSDDGEYYYNGTPEAAQKVEALCGPHYRTIVKAWYILKEIPK